MASDYVKEAIANSVVMGVSPAEIARIHDMTPDSVRGMLATEDMKQRVSALKEQLMASGQQAYFRFLMVADRLAQDMTADALNPDCKDQFRARTWILERIMPQRQAAAAEVNVNVAINQEVMVGLSQALQDTLTVLKGDTTGTPVLLEGKAALPALNG